MSVIYIRGGGPLEGELAVHGAKNSVLPILAACLLVSGQSVIHNCPDLSDVSATLDILRHYYGDNIELVTNAPIRDITYSYPGYPLQNGSSGNYVTVLQVMLNRIGQNYPAIPRTAADGVYGAATQAAVLEFQKIFHLPQTGSVDFAAWYEISNVFVAVAKLS